VSLAAGPGIADIVLVGGGHAHVQALRAFARWPEGAARLTLVSNELATPYSGMLPGLIAGRFRRDEIMIDLVSLCRAAGARFVHAAAEGLDRANRRVLLENRPPLSYDLISFDVGAGPSREGIEGVEWAIAVKPIARFAERFEAFRAQALRPDGARGIAMIGGGAAGVELMLAIAARLRRDAVAAGLDPAGFAFHLIAGGGLLPSYPRRVGRLLDEALAAAGVSVHEAAAIRVDADAVALADGRRVAADAAFVATAAAPHPISEKLGLPLDPDGFIAVEPTLASPADSRVFAVGDCAGMIGAPRPKAGVYAVRQGRPLARNLRRAVRGQPMKPYAPQRRRLSLIGRSDGAAVAAWGPFAASGRWAQRLKDWIDRRWVADNQRFRPADQRAVRIG
jgi:selenide,water dikinase